MEENKEAVVEETTQTPIKEEPKVDDTVEKIKVKKKPKMKKLSQDSDEPIKIDLSKAPKTETDAIQESKTEEVDVQEPSETSEKVVEEKEDKEEIVLEEITSEVEEKTEELEEQVESAVTEAEATGKPIPENIQKLMDFMDETGGDLTDYVKLNQDYSDMDNQTVLEEYYKQTKPHLTPEERSFLMEDQFAYDEDEDTEKEIKRKKLALKEQVASARSHLDGQKSKYYEEIKAGSKLTNEQQKAMDFFNRYNKESEENKKVAEKSTSNFLNKTNKVFSDKFKGFEYNVGDKKYRFNVKNANEVKETQSDINNFVKKFLNKDNRMGDAKGYHKSLYTAMNADAIAKHFYEQGKVDAMKDSVAKAKNVNMNPRQSHGQIDAGGLKFKVLGQDSSDFKLKIKNKNK